MTPTPKKAHRRVKDYRRVRRATQKKAMETNEITGLVVNAEVKFEAIGSCSGT